MTVVFTSTWLHWQKMPETAVHWQKMPETAERGTDKTDKIPATTVEIFHEVLERGTDKTDKIPTGEATPPCACCGGVARWQDHGVARCVACWPSPLTRKALEAERVYQRTHRYGGHADD